MPKIHLKYPVHSSGVDYVSLSYRVSQLRATDQYCLSRLGVDGDIVCADRRQMYGYDGYRSNGRYVGLKHDPDGGGWYRVYELASGSGAVGHDLAAREPHVTVNRIDVQATLLVCDGVDVHTAVGRVNRVIRRVRDHIVRYAQSATGHMRRLSHSWVESSSGGIASATLYVGSRTSNVVTRVYNKTAESGIDDGAGLLRVEVELKDEYAARARQALLQQVGAYDILTSLLARYNIIIVDRTDTDVSVAHHQLTRRSADRTIRWLRSSVSKSVARLVHSEGVDKGYLYALLFGGLGD